MVTSGAIFMHPNLHLAAHICYIQHVRIGDKIQRSSSFPNSPAMARPGSSCVTRDSPTKTCQYII
uniref:Uncharacterized protein n=1 Tax=Arundo donax TaxID=35708 RepID=A0A0A9ARA9_ARUDO